MIKITSFYPFANLLRVTQDFFEDHFVVYTKSISSEHKETNSYSKVSEISDQFNTSGSQQQFTWILLVILSPFVVFLHKEIHSMPALLYTIRAIYIFGLVVFVHSFLKQWHIKIIDENGIILTTIKMTERNRDAVYQAIDMILSKSEDIIENSIINPFPENQPVFEHSYFDFTELKKTIDKFYSEGIIGLENNYLSESVYSIKYKSLSGRIFRGKLGIKVWLAVLSWAMFVLSVLLGLRYIFDFNIISGKPLWYLDLPLLILSAFLWPLIFVKRNVMGLYRVDGRIAYWAYVNKKDEEKFEKIIEFVQSRIPAENKEASLKEHP